MTGKIAKWWLPDDVVTVEAIPHTATGKILKTALRDQFKDYRLPTAEMVRRRSPRRGAAKLSSGAAKRNPGPRAGRGAPSYCHSRIEVPALPPAQGRGSAGTTQRV